MTNRVALEFEEETPALTRSLWKEFFGLSRWTRNGERPEWNKLQTARTRPRWWTGVGGVIVVTLFIQAMMVTWVWDHHLIYAIGDSVSHMTIARRVWDSPNPGLSQLGTTWLPLPHLFFIIPSLWLWAWRTGLGGSFVTVGCAVVTSVSMFRIGQRTGVGNVGGWVGAMIVATNPSWSYVSAVPLTEPFTVATTCLATAGVLRWAQAERPYSAGMTALFCGLPTAAAMLTRYEAWGFAALIGLAFLRVSWQRYGWSSALRTQVLAFAGLPALAVVWWLIFNWSVFGNPLAFENGPYSSKVLVAPLRSLGLLYGAGSIPGSIALYGKTLLDVAGSATALAALAGLAVTIIKWRKMKNELWLCLAGSGVLVMISIWQGQIEIRLPGMIPIGVVNTRYGVESLPFLAVAATQLLRLVPSAPTFSNGRILRQATGLALVVVLSGGWFIGVATGSQPNNALTVLEAKDSAKSYANQQAVGRWLHSYAAKGYILFDDSVLKIAPTVGFDLHRVIMTSSGATWKRLLAHPLDASWLAVQVGNRSDIVWRTMQKAKVLDTAFLPVAAFGSFVIYERESQVTHFSASTLLPLSTSG